MPGVAIFLGLFGAYVGGYISAYTFSVAVLVILAAGVFAWIMKVMR